MEHVTIRYAQENDYLGVETIMHQVQNMHVTWRPDIYKKGDIVLPYKVFKKAVKDNCFLVAEISRQIVGLLFFMIRHIENTNQVTRDILFIDSMAVAEGYCGHGIGRSLFAYVKDIKQQRSLDGFELQVNAKNLDARAKYEKYGFTEKSINMELLS